MISSPTVHLASEILGSGVGEMLYWGSSNASTQPTDRWTRWGLLAGAALGAAIGSRSLYILQYWTALAIQPVAIWLGGKTIVGGLLGGLAATAISHDLEELVGQFESVQRSLLFISVGLEQGPYQLYISPVRAARVKRSN